MENSGPSIHGSGKWAAAAAQPASAAMASAAAVQAASRGREVGMVNVSRECEPKSKKRAPP